MESRRGVAPRACRFAGGRVRWLPRGTKWSGVWVPPPLRRVHGPECTYYTNTWKAGASGRIHTDVVGITSAVPGLTRPRRRNGALARTCTSNLLLRREACRSLTLREQLVARDGVAPSPPVLQTGALLTRAFEPRLVLPHGNAPWSVGYRSTALLLSYRRRGRIARRGWEAERCGLEGAGRSLGTRTPRPSRVTVWARKTERTMSSVFLHVDGESNGSPSVNRNAYDGLRLRGDHGWSSFSGWF